MNSGIETIIMYWIRNILFVAVLAGCIPAHRYVGKDMIPSESACLDGTLINISGAGCSVYYFGNTPDNYIKMRCTYSKTKSDWTEYSFIAIGGSALSPGEGWIFHCIDKHVIMYTKLEK